MNFKYEQEFDNDMDFDNLQHLIDVADALEVNTAGVFGCLEDYEHDQLLEIETELRQAVKAEVAKRAEDNSRKTPVCGIGPYADNYCTICGGRQPGTTNGEEVMINVD